MTKKFKVLQIRMPEEGYEEIEQGAMKEGLSMSEYSRQFLLSSKEALEIEREINRKHLENIEGECIRYLNNSIEHMSLLSFMSLKAYLKKSKNKGVGVLKSPQEE